MTIVKRAAVVAISGFLMGASVSAWAGMPTGNMAAPSHIDVIAAANGPLSATEGALEPSMALQATRQVRNNCQASHIYGADDVWAIRTRASWAAMRFRVHTAESGWQQAFVERRRT